MKSAPVWKIVGVVVLVLSTTGAIWFLDRVPASRLARLAGITFTVSDQESPTPLPQVSVTPLAVRIPSLSLGTVAIQTFVGASLTRSGSGTVVSSDGLILTTAAVAPYASGSSVYQVAVSDGSVLRARSVWRDGSGLVLLKVQGTTLNTVPFDADVVLGAGTEVAIFGAFQRLSRYVPVILPAFIPYISDARDIPLSADRMLGATMSGARVVDASGRSVGVIQLGGPAGLRLIPAATINDFVERYLSRDQH